MDADQIAIEEKKMRLDERRVEMEERKTRQTFWARLGVVVPLAVALLALAGNFWSEHNKREEQIQQAKDAFELKVADLVMNTKSPFETQGRATAMKQLFPERLGENFAARFDPEQATDRRKFENDQRVAAKKELLNLIAAHPEAREQIISTWRTLFPADEWAKNLG
jgi:transcriptional regulator of met regulon